MITATLLPLVLMQVGPNPMAGGIPDYSAELQDRPQREQQFEAEDPGPVPLVPARENRWLNTCLELVVEDPARAHVQAQLQREASVGEPRVLANYCLGMAASELERWSDAQAAFVAARDETPGDDRRLRARFAAMAGNAAVAAGEAQVALQLLGDARNDAVAADAREIAAVAQIDRARLLVSAGRENEALAALGEARSFAPRSAEAWLLSATLMRRLGSLEDAQGAIERAAEITPQDQSVALEAGLIAVLSGRDEAAQASWESVIALAPNSAEADTARGYLAQLEIATVTP